MLQPPPVIRGRLFMISTYGGAFGKPHCPSTAAEALALKDRKALRHFSAGALLLMYFWPYWVSLEGVSES